jgi:hypothetical protein
MYVTGLEETKRGFIIYLKLRSHPLGDLARGIGATPEEAAIRAAEALRKKSILPGPVQRAPAAFTGLKLNLDRLTRR